MTFNSKIRGFTLKARYTLYDQISFALMHRRDEIGNLEWCHVKEKLKIRWHADTSTPTRTAAYEYVKGIFPELKVDHTLESKEQM